MLQQRATDSAGVNYRAEVEAALAEGRRLGFPAAAGNPAYRQISATIEQLLERYLKNPAAVDADEVLALELEIAAASRWYEEVHGFDRWADVRARRVALLEKIRGCCQVPQFRTEKISDFRRNRAPSDSSHLRGVPSTPYDSCVATMPNTDDKQTVGQNIVYARQLREISQRKLAKRLEIQREQLSDWERGEHIPGIVNMRRISIALGFPIDWFFEPHPKVESPGGER